MDVLHCPKIDYSYGPVEEAHHIVHFTVKLWARGIEEICEQKAYIECCKGGTDDIAPNDTPTYQLNRFFVMYREDMLKYAGDSYILGREEPMDLIEDEDADVLCNIQFDLKDEGYEV